MVFSESGTWRSRAAQAHIGRPLAGAATRTAPLLLAVALSWTALAQAQEIPPNKGFVEQEATQWQETPVQLPPMPSDADLLPFDVSTITSQRFAVDGKSLSLGPDGVIRYTLVAVSSSGARNVSYEGIRCTTHEFRIYALGHADGSWASARRSDWQHVVNDAVNRQQAALSQDYFCNNTSVAGKTGDMTQRLRRHESLVQDMTR